MTHKQILFGDHVVQRMQERGFSRADVRWLLAEGALKHEWTRPGNKQRLSRSGWIRRQEAKVVYIETATQIFLVTVEWVYTRGAE